MARTNTPVSCSETSRNYLSLLGDTQGPFRALELGNPRAVKGVNYVSVKNVPLIIRHYPHSI